MTPKESWYVPFGPVKGIELIRVSALRTYRKTTGALYSHGTQLRKIESMFEQSVRASSSVHELRENCTYYIRGRSDSEQRGTLFVIRDGAILTIKEVNLNEWGLIL